MGSSDPEREELEALAESVKLEAGVLAVKALEEPEEA
jgi:hypothetical protein